MHDNQAENQAAEEQSQTAHSNQETTVPESAATAVNRAVSPPAFKKKNFATPVKPTVQTTETVQDPPATTEKKIGRPRKPENMGSSEVYLTVRIDRDMHQRVRSLSFHSGQSIKSIVESWIQDYTPEV